MYFFQLDNPVALLIITPFFLIPFFYESIPRFLLHNPIITIPLNYVYYHHNHLIYAIIIIINNYKKDCFNGYLIKNFSISRNLNYQ